MALFLGIDQSTSATKALLFDESGTPRSRISLPHRQIYPKPGWVEHDAEEIYTQMVAAIATLFDHEPLSDEIVSLSITNQRETFVIFDRESGKPLHNAIVWQCRRGEQFCRALTEGSQGAENRDLVRQRTGLQIDTYFPAPKLRWLLDTHPGLRSRLKEGGALFGTIDTFLIYRLTKGAVYATDHTNASRTLLYDIERLAWDEELFHLFGVPVGVLPAVLESGACFGKTNIEGTLRESIPICGVLGDSQAALFAQGCFAPGQGKVTFGSGSSLLLTLGNKSVRSSNGAVTALAWVQDGTPTYALEGITNFTGATIAWLRDQLRLIGSVEESESVAASVPDNGGVFLVPAFVGLGAPWWRADVRAIITGLTPFSTRAHIVRAALESIAFVIGDALDAMEQDAGIALREIRADGGAVKNTFLMQMVADVSQRPVIVGNVQELSALGATQSGMVGMGVLNMRDLLKKRHDTPDVRQFTPTIDLGRLETLRSGWRHAVSQALL